MRFSHRSVISAAALTACAGFAMAQPANDLCANAIVMPVPGTINGTTVSSLTDGTAACVGSNNDVWYKYTHPIGQPTRQVTVTTCTNTTWDSVLSMHTACGAASSACNDDTCNLQSQISFNAVAGNTYWVRVAGYNTGNTGTFTLTSTINDPPPPPPTPLPNPGNPSPGTGPDVIVGDVIDMMSWGSDATTTAFSMGTSSCNNGTIDVAWVSGDNHHPVIGQNLYRYANNRFELIGVSWLKHGFTALTENLCNTCNGHGGAVLGVGCSDPYTAGLNGNQSLLGPRSHVNATNGYYPYPFTNPPAGYIVPAAPDATVGRRCKVLNTELAVSGRYFTECQYVTSDDATYGGNGAGVAVNGLNNVSYKEVFLVNGVLQNGTGSYWVGTTARGWPALKAWTLLDPTVVLQSYNVDVTVPITAGSGTNVNVRTRFWVGAKVVDNGNGTWTYNYTVFNLNSDRGVGSFELPATNVTYSAPYQHLPVYHSSEPTTYNAAWTYASDANGARWSTPQTFAQNSNSSAIRYSTAATFSVTTNTAPVTGTARLSYFKTAGTLDLAGLPIPGNGTPPCAADFNQDGTVDFFDYLDFVDAFSSNLPSADFNGDHVIDFFDYLDFVDAFSAGC